MKSKTCGVVAVCACFGLAPGVTAQPVNDDCPNATSIALDTPTPGDNLLSNPDGPAFPCGDDFGTDGSTVWYSVTGNGNTLTASLCGGADFDTKLSVYCGPCNAAACVGGDDDGCLTLESEVTWCSAIGEVYLIKVHGFDGEQGTFTLTVTDSGMACATPPDCTPDPTGACCIGIGLCVEASASVCAGFFGGYFGDGTPCDPLLCSDPTPPNDACADAISVTLGVPVAGSNIFGTQDGPSLCGVTVSGSTVWYSVVGTGNTMTAAMCGNADFDTKLSVFCNGCAAPVCVGGDDDGCESAESLVNWCSEAGTEYLIMVHGFFGEEGNFTLTVTDNGVSCPVPADCTPPPTGACCLDIGVCTIASEAVCVGQGGIYRGDDTSCDPGQCDDLTPTNDLCANAIDLGDLAAADAVESGSTRFATIDSAPECNGVAVESPGVWYTFMGTGFEIQLTTCSDFDFQAFADYDTRISVYTGGCAGLTCADANDDLCGKKRGIIGGPNFAASTVFVCTEVGVQYHVLVHGGAAFRGVGPPSDTGNFTLVASQVGTTPCVFGACCLPDGTCLRRVEFDCFGTSVFQGPDTECTPGLCPDIRPPNNECANATDITSVPFNEVVDTAVADADGNRGSCVFDFGPANNSVWYTFTPTSDCLATFTADPNFWDPVLTVYTGGCPGVDEVVCNNIGFNDPVSVTWPALVGNTYLICLYEEGSFSNGSPTTVTFDCTTPTGGCCDGTTCTIETEADCAAAGGAYEGDFTDCGGFASYAINTCPTSFEDISATGTNLGLGTSTSAIVSLPFTLDFFENAYTDVRISSNGYMTFGTDGTDSSNDNIPNPTLPNDYIAVLWDSLDPAAAGAGVFHETLGTAGVDLRFIVQWNNVPQRFNTDSNTFQGVLFEDGRIEFRYLDITPESFSGDYTIGVENSDGSAGFEVDAGTVNDGTCVDFTRVINPNPCDAAVCPCEFDGVAGVDVNDLLGFLAMWFAQDGGMPPMGPGSGADFDASNAVDINDLLGFLSCWFIATSATPQDECS